MSYHETNFVTEKILEVLYDFVSYPAITTGLIYIFEKWQNANDVWQSDKQLTSLFFTNHTEYDLEYWEDKQALFAGILKEVPENWLHSLAHARTIIRENSSS